MSAQNLSVYDFVVDVIPGVAAIILLFSVTPSETLGQLSTEHLTVGSGLFVVIIGYFVGHVIQALASPVDLKIYLQYHDDFPFEEVLRTADEQDSVINGFDDRAELFFQPTDETVSGSELFELVQSYLWNHDIGRSRRFQTLYTFLRSMWVLLALGGVIHIFAIVGDILFNYPLYWSVGESLLIIAGLFGLSYVSYKRRIKHHRQMARSMILDFQSNVLSQTED